MLFMGKSLKLILPLLKIKDNIKEISLHEKMKIKDSTNETSLCEKIKISNTKANLFSEAQTLVFFFFFFFLLI